MTAVNASGTATSADRLFYLAADGSILKEKPAKEDKVDPTSTVEVVAPAPVVPDVRDGGPPTGGARPRADRRPRPRLGRRPHQGARGPHASSRSPRAAAVKVGSVVDTRRGTVELQTALASGRIQKGRFWGSLFEVRQPRSARGRTDLVLRGGRFDRCPSGGRKARASGVTRDVGRTHRRAPALGPGPPRPLPHPGPRQRRRRARDRVVDRRPLRRDDHARQAGRRAVLNRHTGRRVLLTAGHRHLARHPR